MSARRRAASALRRPAAGSMSKRLQHDVVPMSIPADVASPCLLGLTRQTRMDSGNENEDISLTSIITEGDNRTTVAEPISAKINPSDKANFREPC